MCVNCGCCCRLIPVDWESKILLRDGIELLDSDFEDYLIPISRTEACGINEDFVKNVQNMYPNVQFFSCKYISRFNRCTNINPHKFCNFPSTAFATIPENCNYAGEIFLKNEAIKQKIRKLKEEIIDYEAQIATSRDKKEIDHLKKIIIYHQKFIGKFKIYGAKNW